MNDQRIDAAIIARRDELLRETLLLMARYAGHPEAETIVAQYMAGEPVRDRVGARGVKYFDETRRAIVGAFAGLLSGHD